jgi:hypothetical protein
VKRRARFDKDVFQWPLSRESRSEVDCFLPALSGQRGLPELTSYSPLHVSECHIGNGFMRYQRATLEKGRPKAAF